MMENAARIFLFAVSAITPQLVIVGLLLGRWVRKYPEWVEKASASGKAKL